MPSPCILAAWVSEDISNSYCIIPYVFTLTTLKIAIIGQTRFHFCQNILILSCDPVPLSTNEMINFRKTMKMYGNMMPLKFSQDKKLRF
jgi:hypothetical protein